METRAPAACVQPSAALRLSSRDNGRPAGLLCPAAARGGEEAGREGEREGSPVRSFRFRLPLGRPFLAPRRLSPKSRDAAVPAPPRPSRRRALPQAAPRAPRGGRPGLGASVPLLPGAAGVTS